MIRRLLLTLLYLTLYFTNVNSQKLSSEAEISLITCAPGEELYSLFGHSALRVKDPLIGMDTVFNYGTFNFNTPFFYFKYAQARLDYVLSIKHYKDFIRSYQREKRSVYAQELQIDSLQKQQLFDALLVNYQPENRAYRYESFTDNCTTRIDNIIKNTIKGKWEYHSPHEDKFPPTYRTSYAPYLANSDWINLGLNIILGAPMDYPVRDLFLPDMVKNNYKYLTLNGKPIVGTTKILYDARQTYSKTSFWRSPLLFFYSLALLLLLGSIFFPGRMRLVDFLVFATTGLAGCLIIFLWFATDHSTTSNNWNILWALPTHLPIAFVLLSRRRKTKFIRYYFSITSILASILLIFMVFPQLFTLFNYLPSAFPFRLIIPILLCLIFRSLGIIRKKA